MSKLYFRAGQILAKLGRIVVLTTVLKVGFSLFFTYQLSNMNTLFVDSQGNLIEHGAGVLVPEPNETDIHQHEFEGSVVGERHGYVQVEDQEGNCFELEAERLTLV